MESKEALNIDEFSKTRDEAKNNIEKFITEIKKTQDTKKIVFNIIFNDNWKVNCETQQAIKMKTGRH